jgi:colanic acid/amylovoran biosynthesis glycosyltransferase
MGSASSGKIKVVHFVDSWLPQTATWLHNQLRFLPNVVENYIVCKRTENLDQFQLPNIFSLEDVPYRVQYLERIKRKMGLSRPFGLHLPLLEDIIRREKPQVLHTHFGNMGWVNAPLATKYGLKHIVSFYGADVHYVPAMDYRWVARYREMGGVVDQILCEGPFMARSISTQGIPAQKIRVHRLGVDLTKIRYEPRHHEKGTTLRFLIVGTFREKKGIPYALEALGLLEASLNIEITIIGDANPSEREQVEKAKILRAIKQWNLEPKVRMLGVQRHDDVLREAYQHHIFLSPSVTARDGDCEGGAPVSIIEMAASGMPVVSTTHCDIPFVLSDKNAPFLVRERDSLALCSAIKRLISSDWDDLVKNNRRFIERQLDVSCCSTSWYPVYQHLVGTSSTRSM